MIQRRLSFSNIAWELSGEPAAADFLRKHGIDSVDIAPGKYFPDIGLVTQAESLRVRDWWRDRDIEVLGMQALLFGVSGLNLFGDVASRTALLERLIAVARVAGWMGARYLVFGSPKNRDRGELNMGQAIDIAVPFFRTLGDRAVEHGVQFCLEPNPVRYACNFMTTTEECAGVVRSVGHPGIQLHLDAGTMAVNHEDPADLVARHHDVVGYVHASEPDLVPVVDGAIHQSLGRALAVHLPSISVSIEMRNAELPMLGHAIGGIRRLYAV